MILNCPSTYRYDDFRLNALEVAKRELQQKANLILNWQPTKKIGKRVIELEFSIMTVDQLATENVKQDQQVISQMSINEAVATAWKRLGNYKLKPWQKNQIAQNTICWRSFSE